MNEFYEPPGRRSIPHSLRGKLRNDSRTLCEFAIRIANGSNFSEHMLVDEFHRTWETYDKDWRLPALYWLLLDLNFAIRESTSRRLTIDAWSAHFVPLHQLSGSAVLQAFFDEVLASYSERCWVDGAPWLSSFFPVIPQGRAFAEMGARLFGRMLDTYTTSRPRANQIGDLAAECWWRMSTQFRDPPYVNEYCEHFRFPLPGSVIDKYTLECPVGVGGMGIVYLAMHRDNYRVAFKLLRPDCQMRELFAMEARTAVKLTDRRFVRVYDSDLSEDSATPFFTMDFVEGGKTLDDLLHKLNENQDLVTAISGRLNFKGSQHSPRIRWLLAFAWFRSCFASTEGIPDVKQRLGDRLLAAILSNVAEAVNFLNTNGENGAGYCHTDIKPGNILLSQENGPMLGDLGLCRPFDNRVDNHDCTHPQAFTGTISYTSPELAAGAPLTARSDVYQLGAVLFRFITNQSPVAIGSPESTLRRVQEVSINSLREYNSDAHPSLEAICIKALKRKPKDRYDTAEAMAKDLARFVSGEPVHARTGYVWRYAAHRLIRSPLALLLSMIAIAFTSYGFRLHWLDQADIPGVEASSNRYCCRETIPPPVVELTDDTEWPKPSYNHVIIWRSSIYMDASRWRTVNGTPHEAGRQELALYTRVIRLRKKTGVVAENERFIVRFQFLTGGFDVDLRCRSHPYTVKGSRNRIAFGEYEAKVREIAVDITHDDRREIVVVIQGNIWNGFQESKSGTQWAAFLSPDFLTEGELALKFPPSLKPASTSVHPAVVEGAETTQGVQAFKRENVTGAAKIPLTLTSDNFESPEEEDWWVWRPEKPEANYVYSIRFPWTPSSIIHP